MSNNEWDEKIVAAFPLLYADRHASMQETCMCWGFPAPGWNQLIWDLSAKLEPLIKQFCKDNPQLACATCGCPKSKHYACLTSHPGKCLAVHKVPTKFYYNKRWTNNKFVRLVNNFLAIFFYEYQACWCDKYKSSHPRASQVKEKFGSLHFYMTGATDEMWKLIDEAEKASETICESCGKPGTINGGGWLTCLCKECRDKNESR